MADKFRRTNPVNITIAEGEQPTARKITAIASQARSGSRLLEKAVGDLWNQSGDSLLTSYPLKIPNLARLIGATDYLNPAIFHLTDQFAFREKMSTFAGKKTGYLTFPSSNTTTGSSGGSSGVNNVFADEKSNEKDVTATGDYWIDKTNTTTHRSTKFRTFDEITTDNAAIGYWVNPSSWKYDTGMLPGVIPDPRQDAFLGCRISEVSGKFHLHLPPRRPLTFASANDRPARYPAQVDVDSGQNESTSTGDILYWQAATVDAIDHRHFRYAFPKEIQDSISGLAAGDSLPEGFLYLWDLDRQTIIEGVIFRKPSNGETRVWILEVESDSFDFSSVASTTEGQASYNQTRLALITCGAPITRSLFSLWNLFLNHTHSNMLGDFVPTISHNHLEDLDAGDYQFSAWTNDDHPQYLHRTGATESDNRDDWNNAMLGPLLMARSGDDSYPITFGTLGGLNIPSIYATDMTTSHPTLVLDGDVLVQGLPEAFGITQGIQLNSSVAITHDGALGLVNGENNDLDARSQSQIFISGPTGAFSVTGVNIDYVHGKLLYIINPTGFAMTLANDSLSSSAGNRILTGTGADVVFGADVGAIQLIYDGITGAGFWRLVRST